MADEAAPIEQPAAEPPKPAPTEGQQVILTRDRHGRFRKGSGNKPNESFQQTLERHGFGKDEPEEEDEDEEPTAPAQPKPEPPKPKRVDATPPATDETAQLKALAAKLGYTFDGTALQVKERAEFAEYKRNNREKHERLMREERESFDKERQAHAEQLSKATAIIKAYESNDPDALAKALGGHEDWNGLNKHFIEVVTDPNYKQTRELLRWKEEREARELKEREEAETRTKAERRAAAVAEHKKGLAAAMSQSQDRVVSAMSDDPVFIETVFRIQAENYDPDTGNTISPEQAIRKALRGAPRPLLEELTHLRARLNKAFGEAVEAAPTPETPAAPKPKAPKTAVVPSSSGGVEPSANGGWGKRPRSEWFEYQRRVLAEADD